jgi:large subunit ribosomal protein L4
MTTVDILTPKGKTAGTVELPAEIFDVQTNVPLIHQVVVAQLAAARQGTHSTKTRGEVRGGGKKPYRQKGTGRARQGSIRAPQFTGGGITHGPHPRDYAQRTPKKMKAAALRGALSDRSRHGRVHVLSSLVEGETPSTKSAIAALEALGALRNLLVVLERDDQVSWMSLRNLDRVHVLSVDQLNTYDVLVSDDVVFTSGSLAAFLAPTPKGKGAKAVATESEAAPVAVPAEDKLEDKLEAEKPAKKATAKKAEKVAAADAADDTDAPDAADDAVEKPAKKAAAKKAPAKKAAKKAEAPADSADSADGADSADDNAEEDAK